LGFSEVFPNFDPIFAKDKKNPPLLARYKPKKKKIFYAFASAKNKPEAAQKSDSGASFLSSNGHRNHQKQHVLPCDTEPGVTGGSQGCRGGQKIFFPTFPNKKKFLQNQSGAAALVCKKRT
jgi:hypothetical protein